MKIDSINCIIINNIRGEGEGNMVEKTMDGGTYTQKADEIILLEEEER